jgi:hypothetical protein
MITCNDSSPRALIVDWYMVRETYTYKAIFVACQLLLASLLASVPDRQVHAGTKDHVQFSHSLSPCKGGLSPTLLEFIFQNEYLTVHICKTTRVDHLGFIEHVRHSRASRRLINFGMPVNELVHIIHCLN